MTRRCLRYLCAFVALLVSLPVVAEPVTFVSASSQADRASSVTVARPANVQPGDIMIAQLAYRGPADRGFTAQSGWTQFAPKLHIVSGGVGQHQALFRREVTADEPAGSTWGIDSPGHMAVVIMAFRNVDLADPIANFGGRALDTQHPVAPSITVGGVATGDRRALCRGAGRGRPNIGHLTALNPEASDETRLVGAWSRAHAQTCEPEDEAMTRPGGATISNGSGNSGIRALMAYEDFVIEGAVQLSFDQQPSDTSVNAAIAPAVTVRIEDSEGNLVVDSSAEVTLTIGANPGNGNLDGTTTVSAVDGVATFDDLSIDAVGEGYTLIAESDDLDSDESVSFDITDLDQGANAFDSDTPEGAVAGNIRTRIAGEAFAIDIVGIDDGEVDTQFNDDVRVQLVDASDNSGSLDAVNCRDSWVEIQDAGVIEMRPGDNGRVTFDGIEEPEAWREVRVRLQSDRGQQALLGCSNDAFAIRPDAFVDVEIFYQDGDGNQILLDHADPEIDRFRTAGFDFSIEATAVNARDDVTQNYDGNPEIDLVLPACLEPDGDCIAGPLTTGDEWTADDGLLFNDTVRYGEVGAFELIIEDRQFAAVDTDDSTADERFIRSDAPGVVGRFVPDHFTLNAGALTNRAALGCGGDFTYIGERLDASFTLTARNVDGDITQNYTGNHFARLEADELDPGAANNTGNEDAQDLTGDLREAAPPELDWNQGEGTAELEFFLERDIAGDSRRGPFNDFEFGTRPVDVDGVGLLDPDMPLGDAPETHGFIDATVLRFGRLVIDNAIGSELADLDLPLRAEFWDGSTWLISDDDSCTPAELADHVRLTSSGGAEDEPGDQPVPLDSGQTSLPDGTDDPLVLDQGRGDFVFSAPGPGNVGWVDLRIDLEAAGLEYLGDDLDADGDYAQDPRGRAGFGLFSGSSTTIYREEILR